ncbi:hypothetical protein [Vibrio barjaei]|uniref:hypothetical protein n=1 Tax=Vibrio barjaei TaxID=1676683 RepID=UPI002283E469|nr:hypothetical protein [Vibrio barjaei]MCY9870350.1 hypothetical protein [Vibrio barjaei]
MMILNNKMSNSQKAALITALELYFDLGTEFEMAQFYGTVTLIEDKTLTVQELNLPMRDRSINCSIEQLLSEIEFCYELSIAAIERAFSSAMAKPVDIDGAECIIKHKCEDVEAPYISAGNPTPIDIAKGYRIARPIFPFARSMFYSDEYSESVRLRAIKHDLIDASHHWDIWIDGQGDLELEFLDQEIVLSGERIPLLALADGLVTDDQKGYHLKFGGRSLNVRSNDQLVLNEQ